MCLEYKKVLTAYDQLQLTKARDALTEPRTLDESMTALLAQTAGLISLIERSRFLELEEAVMAFDAAPLDR